MDKGRSTPHWTPRFSEGFFQLVDWFWKLWGLRSTPDFQDDFGANVDFMGFVIIGRSSELGNSRERRRLSWLNTHVVIDSKQVNCYTFDEVFEDIEQTVGVHQMPNLMAEARAKEATSKARIT